ncbi:13511_t:CDS:2 [Acaulospora morrowiae]|uniref:13511_t:CDS:1 n=1 Tax=Acaulospora morrowiae TaxID=94023 RepID=A0A9N8WE33_9GLOM|nr:13511_t:CDS:2 [Acaulospora morrowiae]
MINENSSAVPLEYEWLEEEIKNGRVNSFNYNQFTILKEIGTGGFGIVECAEWKVFERKVALKRLKNSQPQLDELSLKEFIREIRLLRKISVHPNVIKFLGIMKGGNTCSLKGMMGFVDPQCYLTPGFIRNEKSDVYSYGVILWEISKPTKNVPLKFIELYKRCQSVNPDKRLNIDEPRYFILQSNRLSINATRNS